MDIMNDPQSRFKVIKQDIDDLKNEVRENNKKIDEFMKSMSTQ